MYAPTLPSEPTTTSGKVQEREILAATLEGHNFKAKAVRTCVAMGQNPWYQFGAGAPPILELILVGIGMFTGGTIWLLSHSHLQTLSEMQAGAPGKPAES